MSAVTQTITLPVCDASEMKNGDIKDFEFGEGDGKKGKVFLAKVDDKLYANSAFCTHYGAPLTKGVLATTEGHPTLRCGWHSACFNLSTGDIEDAPGLDSLHKFEAREENGKILVTANMADVLSKYGRSPLKSDKRAIAPADSKTSEQTVVLIGGGAGAHHTMESLREHGFKGKIVMISKETAPPFDRTKLSKALITDASKLVWRTNDELKDDFKVELHTSTSVTSINSDAKTVTTDKAGAESIKYDHLVIATGGHPKKLPIEGADLDNVCLLRTIEDAQKIVAGLDENAKVAIIGTSFIGMELAGAVLKKKPASIDVIGVDAVPFAKILGEKIGGAILKDLESQGVKFHMESNIEKIAPSESDSKKVGSVVLKNASDIPATIVIMGTGVQPATAFLADSGFKLEDDKGIAVDEYLQVEGKQNIYALGDIAHWPDHKSGEKRRIEHWQVASNQGRTIGQNISAPEKKQAYRKAPFFWSSVGKGLRYVSTQNGFDDIFIDGDVDKELKFVAYYAKGDEVVAVSSMQRDPYVAKSVELLTVGKMPSFSDIKNGKNILDVDIVGPVSKN
ncbi:hypothetical protein QFC22_001426 [Naganishia vaughanmartiniae]|uniref:Uncharacterized protein n=1 Tax=Naganishia vaughanmartiniae TaxID=1424756 RepID=A0ACC2XHX5_9TREE|nr:hypothetical protein QFC22_001426 [Naganishia vaughanmartiniae]